MAIGRFIWGLGYGAFSVLCAKFVNEITPIELIGPFGAMNQLSLTFGAALPSTLALAYPEDIKDVTYDGPDFYVNQYFRIIWATPLVISLIQVLLMMTCFRNESPVYLAEQGRQDEITAVFKKWYHPTEVRKRLDALNAEAQKQEGSQEAQEETIKDTFFDPRIRGAAWVGFWLCTAQQFTGINAIMFYSGQLFVPADSTGGLTSVEASNIINWSNFVATIGGTILLNYFGRRTLNIGAQIFCCIGMFGMFVFQQVSYN